jgi:hypothetical protein
MLLVLSGLAIWSPSRASAQVGTIAPGAWSWFGDPRAVHVGGEWGKTFVGWIDWTGDVTIGAYDPRLGLVSERGVAHIFHDDHSDPSLLVESDQRLTVFWSGHNGAQLDYRTTVRPGDITAWTSVAQIRQGIRGTDGFTYPNPVLLPAERDRLYLFWRGADWSADVATREPDGAWEPARELIRAPGQRPYVKVADNGSDAIALAFTEGHPRNVLSSIYYATYRSGSLWTAAGRWITRLTSAPIAPAQAQVVYDARAAKVPAWVWDVAFGRDGRPVIVYATFPSHADSVYWYATFDGKRWVSHRLTDAGGSISPRTIEYEYSGGITLDHSDPRVLYLSREVTGGWEIQRWSTTDGGGRWTRRTVVPSGGTQNVRPVVPRGYRSGPMGLLWLRGDYRSYTTYRTTIAFLK